MNHALPHLYIHLPFCHEKCGYCNFASTIVGADDGSAQLFLDYLSDKLMVFDGIPAKNGIVKGPFSMEEGMNMFLDKLGITLRRDKDSNMARVNKLDSRLDREQKEKGKYYYS